jgi:predicted MFS family arabinose efflux permease
MPSEIPTWLGVFAIGTFCGTVALGYVYNWSTGNYLAVWALWFGMVKFLAVLVERSRKKR